MVMWFRTLLDALERRRARAAVRQSRRPTPCRLAVETLDDRIVPASPVLSVGSAAVAEGNVGSTTAAVVVTLSGRSHQTVTVNYDTAGGTAVAGEDYLATSGKLTFAPGETSRAISVPVVGDRTPENDEQFFVRLSGARNATIAPGYGVVTVVDDEPRIAVSSSGDGHNGASGTTPVTFTVSLWAAYSRGYDQAVTVNYATADDTAVAGVDYVAVSGTLTFAPGETTKTITVEVIGYPPTEAYKDFVMNLSGASANALLASGVPSGQAYGFIWTDAYDPSSGSGGLDYTGYGGGFGWS
jgi:hypothetical protein